jgi:hypothetical protein
MIAGELGISYDTVRNHVKKNYEKLHVASISQVVFKAMNEKLRWHIIALSPNLVIFSASSPSYFYSFLKLYQCVKKSSLRFVYFLQRIYPTHNPWPLTQMAARQMQAHCLILKATVKVC